MVYPLYDAKPSQKELWIGEGAEHAKSYLMHRDEYGDLIKKFALKYVNPNGVSF